jgi:hypothetical protein
MKIKSPRVLLACALVACGLNLNCVSSVVAQASKQPPPQPTNNQNVAASQTPSVLSATNAREIATVTCTSAPGATCFSADAQKAIAAIKANFNGTLLGNDGKDDSALANAIVSFLGSVSFWPSSVDWATVHLVLYDANNQAHDKWLRAHRKAGAITVDDLTHIPGAKEIAIVFLHMNVAFSPKNDPKTNTPLADQSLVALDNFSSVSYRAIVAKKLPYPIQNLLGILKLFPNSQAESANTPLDIAGGGVIQHVDVPSDVTAFAVQLGASEQLIGQSLQYDNEGKYFWDVSLGVPVNKLSLINYDSTNNVFTPTTINKQSVYALVDLYPDLVDLKYGNKRFYLPRAVAGVGLTGRPGENFMFGGAWGIKELQFFAGSAFAVQTVATAGSMPSAGAVSMQRYASRLVYGINVPIVSAIKQLTSKSSSSSSSGSSSK